MSSDFWDGRAESYDEGIRKHDGLYNAVIEQTTSFLTESDRVLDFGCASGEMSLDIAPHVQHVHGIDVSGKMIALAQEKAQARQTPNVEFSQTDLFAGSLTSQSFNAIVAFNILHLVDEPSKALDRIYDLLAPGGVLISQTPCLRERGWILGGIFRVVGMLGLVPKVHSFDVHRLETIITDARFEMVESTLWDDENKVQWVVAKKA